MSHIAYFEGNYIPEHDANINIKTHAFLYGTSIFEGIRGYWNPDHQSVYLLRAKEHFDRLLQSAKIVWMDTTLTADDMVEICAELLRKNEVSSDVYLQPRLYKSSKIVPPQLDNLETDFCCFMLPFGKYLDTDKALKVAVSTWRRVSDNAIAPRGKIGGAYVNTALAMAEAHMNGFDDAIFLTEDGFVSEGSGMNFFMIKDGKLVTPMTTDNILEGITRASIMDIAKNELGLETIERRIHRTELYLADEAFFTGTAAQVASIGSIDLRPIGSGHMGEITKKLQTLYIDIAKGNNPNYSHWLKEVKTHVNAH